WLVPGEDPATGRWLSLDLFPRHRASRVRRELGAFARSQLRRSARGAGGLPSLGAPSVPAGALDPFRDFIARRSSQSPPRRRPCRRRARAWSAWPLTVTACAGRDPLIAWTRENGSEEWASTSTASQLVRTLPTGTALACAITC